MLAYVFWHVPRAGVASRDYELAHRDFHKALWRTPVAGVVGQRVFRLSEIPWLAAQQPGYEDWHLLADSAALDRLNDSAVTRARQMPHDRVAAMAATGTAGLYALRQGSLVSPAVAYWMSKPAGMSYADFDASLAPFIRNGCCLWGRRMTLGPAPEFCLHGPAGLELPHPAQPLKVESLWSDGPA